MVALQRAEVVFFAKEAELPATRLLLSLFEAVPVDTGIVDLGGELYRSGNLSHGVDVTDALLAATVMKTGGKIHTAPQNDGFPGRRGRPHRE